MLLNKTSRNQRIVPENAQALRSLRSGKWTQYKDIESQALNIQGKLVHFRTGLTFTPYANPTKCNAHCRFCSEELRRKHQNHLTAERIIQDYDQYFEALAQVFRDLSPLREMGLSLSGLEATSDPLWLLQLLETIKQNEISLFNEKVLYTNGSGLYKYPDLVIALKKIGFDRIELSRCHYDDQINQRIMYINRNQPVYQNEAYEDLVKRLHGHLFVKNSCILTQTGINSIEEVEQYLDWALSLGVKRVVFRELSQLDENYENNATKQWVESNRVPIDGIIQAVCPQLGLERKHWQYQYSTAGYYYYNEHYSYKGSIEVILETSSYTALIAQNETGMIQKLVFHSNGNLCGDWDPDSTVIANYF